MTKREQGNYHDYYKRRGDVESDHRLQLIRAEWLNGKVCLDIGCNEGQLTLALAKRHHPISMVGIDIDRHLVDTANSRLKREKMVVTNGKAITPLLLFKPRSVPSPFTGTSVKSQEPARSTNTSTSMSYPHNAMFIYKDVFDMTPSLTGHYDTIMCLSMTKWVHLTYGDEGLRRLFDKMFTLLKIGGILILEYQTWRSYKSRKGTNETTSVNYDNIVIRPEQFAEILTHEYRFRLVERLGPTDEESREFNRPIIVLQKELAAVAAPVAVQVHGDVADELQQPVKRRKLLGI
ncbi:methyltransferase domain-containing protein [archaeon]|nr:MAG: methyltransferase domain-containing protein [archaeon]